MTKDHCPVLAPITYFKAWMEFGHDEIEQRYFREQAQNEQMTRIKKMWFICTYVKR